MCFLGIRAFFFVIGAYHELKISYYVVVMVKVGKSVSGRYVCRVVQTCLHVKLYCTVHASLSCLKMNLYTDYVRLYGV